jgi:hypothetical protein
MDKQLIRALIQEGLRQNQNVVMYNFLREEVATTEAQVDALVENLISKLDKDTLRRRANL